MPNPLRESRREISLQSPDSLAPPATVTVPREASRASCVLALGSCLLALGYVSTSEGKKRLSLGFYRRLLLLAVLYKALLSSPA